MGFAAHAAVRRLHTVVLVVASLLLFACALAAGAAASILFLLYGPALPRAVGTGPRWTAAALLARVPGRSVLLAAPAWRSPRGPASTGAWAAAPAPASSGAMQLGAPIAPVSAASAPLVATLALPGPRAIAAVVPPVAAAPGASSGGDTRRDASSRAPSPTPGPARRTAAQPAPLARTRAARGTAAVVPARRGPNAPRGVVGMGLPRPGARAASFAGVTVHDVDVTEQTPMLDADDLTELDDVS